MSIVTLTDEERTTLARASEILATMPTLLRYHPPFSHQPHPSVLDLTVTRNTLAEIAVEGTYFVLPPR